MYIFLILSFITSLIIFQISYIESYNSSLHGFWNKNKLISSTLNKEKDLYYSIGIMCDNNLTYCLNKDDGTGNLDITLTDISSKGFNTSVFSSTQIQPFTKIIINDDNKTMTFYHSFTTKDLRKAYVNNNTIIKGIIECDNGSALPCSSSVVKKTRPILEEFRIAFIDKRIEELDAIISDPNSSISEKIAAQNEKNDLNDEKDQLNQDIANRKDLVD